MISPTHSHQSVQMFRWHGRRYYTRATYRHWFERGEPAGEEPNTSEKLKEIGCDPDKVLTAAQSDRIVNALATATKVATELGVFGLPTFVVDGEVFWGDDRLHNALLWAHPVGPKCCAIDERPL